MNKTAHTLRMLRKQWLTPFESARRGGVFSLSQRVSEWRRQGIVVRDKWVDLGGGVRVKAYRAG